VKPHSKVHPIRGGLFGFELGGAIVVLLILYGQWDYTSFTPGIFVVVTTAALGTLWGLFGPARGPKSKDQAIESQGDSQHGAGPGSAFGSGGTYWS
jgi:hypothetical protein